MKEYDVAIVGAGAAGMTAAIYALRAKKSVVLFERLSPGGQVLETTKIENYPGLESVSGGEFAEKLRGQVKRFGGEFVSAEVSAVTEVADGFEVVADDEKMLARSVILANGSRERCLGLPREAELTGRGVSYCATCDGALFRGKTVAVYGGGNAAAYSVMYLAGMCAKVYWIFRKPEPRAERHLVEKVAGFENVEVLNAHVITELVGDEKLTGVKFASGEELAVEGLFVLVGREADNERFRGLVDLDENGYIKSSEACETSHPGVFVAGDTRAKKLHQIVTATADGAVAASAAVKYLNNK
ncbi:FAD-dependent oxidoreductase [Candidatus Saccharibacteria bacterium]|nr:FAD-dependent oxidoreductase [Candidatus Saccharibacteria bacterium]